jgi:lysophospholipid acyltransferase (LPLAT)-like uncharacterized protein
MIKHLWHRFKHRGLSHLIAYMGKYAVRVILWTCRIEVEGLDTFVKTAAQQRCLLMLWHNRLAIVSEVLHKKAPQFNYAALISKSRDGEPLALVAESYKQGRAIRVPHSAKHQALKTVIDNLKSRREVVLMTPDGPRGPRYKIKPGIVMAAQEADAVIIPFTWTAVRYWSFRTWDQLMLPKPFTTIRVKLGDPIKLPSEQPVDQATAALENILGTIEPDHHKGQ